MSDLKTVLFDFFWLHVAVWLSFLAVLSENCIGMVSRDSLFGSAWPANDLLQVLEIHLLGASSHNYRNVLLAHLLYYCA